MAFMLDRVHSSPNLIYSVGTQIVTLVDILGLSGLVAHRRGAVGVIIKSPSDYEHSYRIRFPDGFEAPLKQNEITTLALFKKGEVGDSAHEAHADLHQQIIYRFVNSPQARGLAGESCATDAVPEQSYCLQ